MRPRHLAYSMIEELPSGIVRVRELRWPPAPLTTDWGARVKASVAWPRFGHAALPLVTVCRCQASTWPMRLTRSPDTSYRPHTGGTCRQPASRERHMSKPQSTPPALSPSSSSELSQVARFEHQVTGVAVAKDGHISVNFPRWSEDAPVSVAEVMTDGSVKPFYPTSNGTRGETPRRTPWIRAHTGCAFRASWSIHRVRYGSSIPRHPRPASACRAGPSWSRLICRRTASSKTISFDERAAPQGTYLNDVRFSPDGQHAYITDSGCQGWGSRCRPSHGRRPQNARRTSPARRSRSTSL